ncbi:DNA repair protein RecO [Roseospira goensis]|uniref:DNA repair protein RecO n=1 Tax=Roseospira goensis TaxID=391922 RepID=A0A7W6S0M2_9PROT|nr:DNA repair protein RecO [Roseospira goensis]MBB4286700.1 DNA repair protein RecO (recombination protein O) [Roseospira goensis]
MAVEWRDEAIVLSARPHGETSLVAAVLTATHGRQRGLVRGGTGKAARGLWQPGNRVRATWRARLPNHLGTSTAEMMDAVAARVMADPGRLAVLAAACAVADATLPEREAVPQVYADTVALLAGLAEGAPTPCEAAYVLWELGLLADLGYGLDLSACAATGTNDDLVYVSPKSGRAVSASAGEPYRDRLLPLPAFLRTGAPADMTPAGVADGLRLAGFFLARHVFDPRGQPLPAARVRLAARMVERTERPA